PEDIQAGRIYQLGIVPVIRLVLVEDVAQSIPMRSALHAEHDGVVSISNLIPVLLTCDCIGAGRQHLVNGVEASAEEPRLRAFGVERNAKCKDFSLANSLGRLDDQLRRDEVQRADLVFLAPSPPV